MNVYPAALDAFLSGALDITTAALRAQLIGSGYTYSATHTSTADLADTIASPVAVTGAAVSGGVVTIDPITFPAVPTGDTIAGVVVYQLAGLLVCHIDEGADTVPMAIATDDGDITMTFARLFKI